MFFVNILYGLVVKLFLFEYLESKQTQILDYIHLNGSEFSIHITIISPNIEQLAKIAKEFAI